VKLGVGVAVGVGDTASRQSAGVAILQH
jgi:hypothetical protein